MIPLRVLYFGWRRARLRALLEASPRVQATVIGLDPRRDLGRGSGRKLADAVRAARREPPDLVLADSPGVDGLVAQALAHVLDRPFLVRLKGDVWREERDRGGEESLLDLLVRRASGAIARRVFERADLVLPLTEALAARARSELGPDVALEVVPIEVRPAPSIDPPMVARRLLTVTSFGFREKIEPLLRAASILAPVVVERGLGWRILGTGRHLAWARRRLAAVPVELVGWGDAEAAYAEGPIVVYPSGLDGLPNVVLEAAARGLPIVVDRGSPAAALVEDGLTALVLDLDRPDEARARLRRLLEDHELRAGLGRRARSTFLDRYGPERVGRLLEAALFRAAGRSDGLDRDALDRLD